MKARLISILAALSLAVSIAGCSGSSSQSTGESSVDAESADAKALLEEALENFAAEEMKSMDATTVTTYDDGLEDEEACTYIYDQKNQIIESIAQDEEGEETYLHTFHVKDQDTYRVYEIDAYNDGDWVVYDEELEDDEQSEYEYLAETFSLAIDEEHGYKNITYSNEGEDVVNDVDAITLKVTATEEYDSGDIETDEITREDILDEYGWTEDEVSAVEGFSDVLDDYVTAINQENDLQSVETEITVWVSEDAHQLLRVRENQDLSASQDEETQGLIQNFENESWKADLIHEQVSENGKSIEEAQELLAQEIEKLNNPQADVSTDAEDADETQTDDADEEESATHSDESTTDDTGFDSAVLTIVTTRKFKTGDNCPEMGSIPEDAQEVNAQEYYESGFEAYQEEAGETESEEDTEE